METLIRRTGSNAEEFVQMWTWKRKPLRLGTWNVRSLYRPGYARTLVEEIMRYRMDITALQEIRWTGEGNCTINGYKIIYSARNDGMHRDGVGFCVNQRVYNAIESFNPIDERLLHLRINCKLFKLSLVVAFAPTEDEEDDRKDEFYDKLRKGDRRNLQT